MPQELHSQQLKDVVQVTQSSHVLTSCAGDGTPHCGVDAAACRG